MRLPTGRGGAAGEPIRAPNTNSSPHPRPRVPAGWSVPPRLSGEARDIHGSDPAGRPASLRVRAEGGAGTILLLFMSSDCLGCAGIWHDLRTGEHAAKIATSRTVIVTRGPSSENCVRLAALSPPGAEIIMSSSAFQDYQIPAIPYFIHLAASSGTVVSEGVPASLECVASAMAPPDGEL